MIVVDTNVIASLWLDSEHSANAEAALRRDSAWLAPLLWRSELRDVLASLVRSGRMQLGRAVEVAQAAEALLSGREYAVPSVDVLAAAHESGCTAYDCEFVVLARSVGCTLVTLDRAVLAAFPEAATPLPEFAA